MSEPAATPRHPADRGHGHRARPPITVVRALARRGLSVLMLRRAGGDSLGGCWELPGGKVDHLVHRSEHPVEALARELHEECGLQLRGTPRLIASTPRVSPGGRLMRELTYIADVGEGAERLSDEHDEARWQPLHAPAPGPLTDAAHDGLRALRAAAAA